MFAYSWTDPTLDEQLRAFYEQLDTELAEVAA